MRPEVRALIEEGASATAPAADPAQERALSAYWDFFGRPNEEAPKIGSHVESSPDETTKAGPVRPPQSSRRTPAPAQGAFARRRARGRQRGAQAQPSSDPAECPECGSDTCPGGCRERPRPALRFRSAAELILEPPPVAIIGGLAWAGRISVCVSESGVGKTFVALDAAVHVANGQTWHGRRVQLGSVAYLSFEGDAFPLRLQPLKDAGLSLEDVHVVRAGDPLSPRVERDGVETCSLGEAAVSEALAELSKRLQANGRPPLVLVVVDTVRASLSGSEDSSEHVSAYLRAVRRIMAPLPQAAAVLLHHAGWLDGEQKKKRERGSSAFRGNADATLYLEVVDDDPENHRAFLELKTLKARDAERPAPLRLVRQRVDVSGFDAFGNPLSSCAIMADTRRREDQEAAAAAKVKAAHQEQDVRTLRAIADRPEVATSQERVRQLLGVGKEIASASVARLIRAGWILPGGRGKPYTLTDEGSRIVREQGSEA